MVKGTPAWVYKQALILNCNHLLYLIIHSYYIYICPYGFDYYIPNILDNSCVSELCSSHLVSELRFLIPAFGQSLYQTLSDMDFSQPHRFRVSLKNLVFDHQPGLWPFKFSKFLGTSVFDQFRLLAI